jgi:hypothetical protein
LLVGVDGSRYWSYDINVYSTCQKLDSQLVGHIVAHQYKALAPPSAPPKAPSHILGWCYGRQAKPVLCIGD